MSLRAWGWRRVVLAWAYYWLLLAAAAATWLWADARRLAREYGSADFVHGYAVNAHASALVLFGPPIALTLVWLWVRRRRG